MELNGLRAMMVGGASGMCRATAERIVAGGGSVAIVDREESSGAEAAAQLGGSWHPVNVLDYAGTELVINEAVEALGGLDAMVNTPGGGKAGRTVSKQAQALSGGVAAITTSIEALPEQSKAENFGLRNRIATFLETGAWPDPPPKIAPTT